MINDLERGHVWPVLDPANRLTAALAGRYTLEREIGAGGMATVYLARDVRHNRSVALKLLKPELGAVLGVERFLAEIQVTANLQHPNLLPLFDSGEADGLLFYVMPYVEGESLRHRIDREKQLPVDEAVRIATAIASALDYAHARGVIHRDLKPENILLQAGQPVIADFGIALAVSNAGGARITQTGLSLGTPQYMSPEQATGDRTIDGRTDIYSLGALLYEMLAGEPPHSGTTAQAIIAKLLSTEPQPVLALRPAVPANVNAAVGHALEKLPADRFATAGAFAAALANPSYTGPRGTHATAPSPSSQRQRLTTAALALAAILGVGWGAWVSMHRPPAPRAVPVTFTVPAELARNVPGRLIAIAADGSKFIFVQNLSRGGASRLAIRRLDQNEALPIPGTENVRNPFFSPDGEWVGFEEQGRIRKLRLSGGAAMTVAEVGPNYDRLQGTWGADGTILFTTLQGDLFHVPDRGGTPVRMPLPKAPEAQAPVWLPVSDRAVVTRRRRSGGQDYEMVLFAPSSGSILATIGPGLAVGYVDTGHLVYLSPEGQLAYATLDAATGKLGAPEVIASGFSYLARSVSAAVSRNGSVVYATEPWSDKEMVLVNTDGAAQVVPVGVRAFRGPRFSPNGRQIAVDVEPNGDLLGDIYLFDRSAGTFMRLTTHGTAVFPEWTPDGAAVLYSAVSPEGDRALYRAPVDRSAPPQVILRSDSGPIVEAVMTPRGDTMLFRVNSEKASTRDIFMRNASGIKVPFAAGPYAERSPAISPDGRLVLYVSDESGREEVYLRELARPGSVLVSNSGGTEPRWGPAGREAYYWGQDTLFAVQITRTPSPAVGPRRKVLVGRYAREAYHSNYDVAPDGKSFVFLRATRGDSASSLTVLLNWIPK